VRVHFRQAARRGGLVVLAALAASCGGGPPEEPNGTETVQELKAQITALDAREDPDSHLARARLYARLRRMRGVEEVSALARGDGHDLQVLGGAAQAEPKAEAARRIASHFLERAEQRALCRSVFVGPLAEPLRRFSMVTVAARFSEYSSPEAYAAALEKMAAVSAELGDREELKEGARERWQKRGRSYAQRATELRAKPSSVPPAPDTLKFCEYGVSRHLEEATRAMDFGTREKAARGEPERILDWYLLALSHLVVARECLDSPTEAECRALEAQEIALQSVTAELIRDR
jgi:hypothetical protein